MNYAVHQSGYTINRYYSIVYQLSSQSVVEFI